jgi:aminomethyltransferase
MDENRFWLALASSDALLYAKGLAAQAGMEVELRELDVAPLQIQGPKSKDVVRTLFGDGILELKYYFFVETEIEGIPVVVTRTGWTSEVGYEIYLCDPARGTELWELIMEAGKPYEIRPTGPCDIRRIEGGIFNWGADMTYENNPFELGLERLVGLDVPCVARDALNRIATDGPRRRLVGVALDGERFPFLNFTKWPVLVDGAQVGKITSAVYSPRLEQNIGYAWVPVELATVGTQVRVESEWGSRTGEVAALPFWDPEKAIPAS